jgi:hypothetical protein
VIYLTPDGWRRSTRTTNGALFCGSLSWIEPDASDEQAKWAAEGSVATFCTEFFHIAVDVTWAENESHSWIGTVFRTDGQPLSARWD